VLAPVVGEIEIVGFAGPFGAYGVDFFDVGQNVELGSDHAYFELGAVDVHGYLFVREAELFDFEQDGFVELALKVERKKKN
jgi:hypothetical protein